MKIYKFIFVRCEDIQNERESISKVKKERTENRGSKAATGTKVGGYQSHCTMSLLLDRTLCVAFQAVHIYLARPYGAKKNFYELFTFTLPTQAQRYIPLMYVTLNMSSFKLKTIMNLLFKFFFRRPQDRDRFLLQAEGFRNTLHIITKTVSPTKCKG